MPTATPTPTPTPTPTATPTPAGFLGCPYPSGDVWQTDIFSASPDPNSAAYVTATAQGGGGGSFGAYAPTTNEKVNSANNSTPLVTVNKQVAWHIPYSPIPWMFSPPFYIEPLSDAHSLVLQTDTCQYYEQYGTKVSGTTLSAYNNQHVDLTAPFVRPPTGATSTASGVALGLCAVRPEELTAGVISHALCWDATKGSLSKTACVSPAGSTDCTDGLTYNGPPSDTPAPYGAHIRLKASVNCAAMHREAAIVCTALQHYGAYAMDTASSNELIFINDINGAPTWTSSDSSDLGTISITNFDFLSPP